MLPRFSFLSQLTYDQHLLASNIMSATQGLAQGPAKDVVQATLYGNLIGAQATIRSSQEITSAVMGSGQQTVSAIESSAHHISSAVTDSGHQTVAAIQDSTQVLSGQMHKAMLANVFGSLLVSGTIAVSTGLMLKRMDKINVGIERLGAQFTEGMSLLASKLDVQTNALTDIRDQLGRIHETLKSPTITLSTEQRNLGLQRLGQGLWKEAEGSFCKAITLDETDPISHLMLGKIYLDAVNEDVNLHDATRAQAHLAAAKRYAVAAKLSAPKLAEIEEEASYLVVVALLAMASRLRAEGVLDNAQPIVEQALASCEDLLKRYPDHRQGMYLRAKLLVLLERKEAALAQFTDLTKRDSQFLCTALADADFVSHSKIGRAVIEAQELWYRDALREALIALSKAIDAARAWSVVPEEFETWLIQERIALDDGGIAEFASRPFAAQVSTDKDTLSLLKMAVSEMSKALVESQSAMHSIYDTLYGKVSDLVRSIAGIRWTCDPDWIQHPLLQECVEQGKRVQLPNLDLSSYTAADTVLSDLRNLKENSESFVERASILTSAMNEAKSRVEKILQSYHPERALIMAVVFVVIGLMIMTHDGEMAFEVLFFGLALIVVATWVAVRASIKSKMRNVISEVLSPVCRKVGVSSSCHEALIQELMG